MEVINNIIDYSTQFIAVGGIPFGFFLVFLECFIPALPLIVFVTLNINAFGLVVGILISWLATCLGSFVCYSIFSHIKGRMTNKFLERKWVKKLNGAIDRFKEITFSELVLIITLPFTPSFLVNIVSGLSGVGKKKFLCALLIGKVFMISFCGFVGTSLINSTDIKSFIFIGVALLIAYILSKIVSKKMNIE